MDHPVAAYLKAIEKQLQERREAGLSRQLQLPAGVDFASNDYLGLARHPVLGEKVAAAAKEFAATGAAGAPASRLLRGNLPAHRAAEKAFSRFKGAEDALLFTSGYHANLGLLTATIGRQDRVLSDELNHASLIDGLRLTRCHRVVYPHLDLNALEDSLKEPHRGGRTFVVTESLFSMDGDIAPLAEMTELARRHDALVVVDEAHATGLFGEERGSGLVELLGLSDEILATTSTCGKSLGLCGAVVTGSRVLIDQLVNHARSFIYTTAPLPLLAASIPAALDIIEREPWRRRRALTNAQRLRRNLARIGVGAEALAGPIVPVPIGDNHAALEISRAIQAEGYDVRALRPPTVPPGTARLRISVHCDHTEEEIDGVGEAIANAVCRSGIESGL